MKILPPKPPVDRLNSGEYFSARGAQSTAATADWKGKVKSSSLSWLAGVAYGAAVSQDDPSGNREA